LRPGAYDAHLPFYHIDKLRQFIDLCPPQNLSKWQNAGIILERNGARADVGTVSMAANLITSDFYRFLG